MLPAEHEHNDPPFLSFEQRLQLTPLPPPGPDYYAARRSLWLTPPPSPPPTDTEPAPSIDRLRYALNTPGALESDQMWNNGIERTWKGLSSGATLRRRIPLNILVKIVYAAWRRDGTWPAGAIPPQSNNIRPPRPLPESVSRDTPPPQPGASTPWMIVNGAEDPLQEDFSIPVDERSTSARGLDQTHTIP